MCDLAIIKRVMPYRLHQCGNVHVLFATPKIPQLLDKCLVYKIDQRAQDFLPILVSHRGGGTRPKFVGAAATLLLALVGYWVFGDAGTEEFYRDGDYVWINGKPYLRTTSFYSPGQPQANVTAPKLRPVDSRNTEPRIDLRGLVPRKRTTAIRPEQISIGETATTGPGQRLQEAWS